MARMIRRTASPHRARMGDPKEVFTDAGIAFVSHEQGQFDLAIGFDTENARFEIFLTTVELDRIKRRLIG